MNKESELLWKKPNHEENETTLSKNTTGYEKNPNKQKTNNEVAS